MIADRRTADHVLGPVETADVSLSSLRFTDPTLEAAYWAHFFRTRRSSLLAGVIASIVVTFAFGAVDFAVASDRLGVVWSLRYGFAIPVMLLSIPLLKMRRFGPYMERRVQEVLLGFLSVVVMSLYVMSIVMLDGADFRRATAVLAGWIVVMVTTLGVTRLRFLYAVPFSVVSLVAAVMTSTAIMNPEPGFLVIGGVCAMTITAVGLLSSYSLELYDRRDFAKSLALAAERARADRLLMTMLPETVALELKRGVRAIAHRYEETTILFADLSGFTSMSETAAPAEIVRMLDRVFAHFDALALAHGVEKVKTLGDAFMAVAGAPTPCDEHALVVARLAQDMLDAMPGLSELTGWPLRVRVGIASGAVVAGVIGTTKPAWDVWGDAVNTASRMESHGEPGRIQLAPSTAVLLDGVLAMTPRGEVLIKGKGTMSTFWLEAPASS